MNSHTFTGKFLANAKSHSETWYHEYGEQIQTYNDDHEENRIVFQPFFDLENPKNPEFQKSDGGSASLKEIMRLYYAMNDNSIHHFGLQIFNSVVTSKNGLFSVSGHDSYYCQKMPEKELDTGIPGASYKVLIPFISSMYASGHVAENIAETDTYKMGDFHSEIIEWENTAICSAIKEYRNCRLKSPEEKERCINDVASAIEGAVANKQCAVFVFSQSTAPNDIDLELFAKGLLKFLLSNQNHPIAVVDLSSHGFLEIIRLISLLYDKNGESSDSLNSIQIYVSGEEIGEEMLFCGNKLFENASRLQKAAMMQGTMPEYCEIANGLMGR